MDDPRVRAVLQGPIGPHFLRHDSVVFDEGGWYRIMTPSAPWPSLNEVILSSLDDQIADAQVDALLDAHRAHDLPLKWCVYPWTKPDDLGERLLRRGAIHWKARGMVCDSALSIDVPNDVEVRRIDLGTLETYVRVMADGWGLPPSEEAFMRQRFSELLAEEEPAVHLFVALIEEEPAGSAATWIKPDSGYLMGANVLPAFRGRGLYRALLEGRLDALRSGGIELATTQAREATSAPMLEHLGFETVFRHELYQLNPLPDGGSMLD